MIIPRKPLSLIKQSLFPQYTNASVQHNDRLHYAIGRAGISANRSHYHCATSLWDVDYKVFSQFGDDGIIDFLCSSLSLHKPIFIEIGTEDYSESNTRFLYQLRSARGLIIDCDPDLIEKSNKILGEFLWKGEISQRSAFVSLDNACSLVHGFHDADILSLDIDGNDYWILSALLQVLQPKILIVEFNAYFGDKEAVTIPYDPGFVRSHYHYSGLAFGASLKAFLSLTSSKFRFLGTNLHCNNAYFIRHDYVQKLPNSFLFPDPEHVSEFTRNFTRESRREDGSLSYLPSSDRLNTIQRCMLVDLSFNPPQMRSAFDIYNS